MFKDILQRIILTARFEDATPPECKIICLWIDRLNKAVTYVMFDRHEHPRFKLDCSPWYSGMTAGVCWMSLSSSTITAHSCLNNRMNSLEVNLSKQSAKEYNLSVLLMIDSHHQQ